MTTKKTKVAVKAIPPRGRVTFQAEMTDVELFHFCGGQVAVYSSRCPDKETVNEDAFAIIPYGEGRGVLAVADGAGGMRAGEAASRRALKQLKGALEQGLAEGWPLREAILEGFDRANLSVAALGGAASTLAACEVVCRGATRTYHAGDTPALVVSGRGAIKLKTVDHSPVGYAVEAGVLDEADAIHHQLRHVISNFLGNPEMHIEVSASVTLAVRDRLLVASDGLFDNLLVDEIVDIIRRGKLRTVARTLLKSCRERMTQPGNGLPSKPDDLTFLLYRPVQSR